MWHTGLKNRTDPNTSDTVYQQQNINLMMMGEHRCPMKFYNEYLYNQLQNRKYQGDSITLDIDGKIYTKVGNINEVINRYQPRLNIYYILTITEKKLW